MISTKIEKVGLMKKMMAIRNTEVTKVNSTSNIQNMNIWHSTFNIVNGFY